MSLGLRGRSTVHLPLSESAVFSYVLQKNLLTYWTDKTMRGYNYILKQSLRSHGRLKDLVRISWTGEKVANHSLRNHDLQRSSFPWIPSIPRARTVLINIKCRFTHVKSCQEIHILTTYVYCRLASCHLVRLFRCFATAVQRYTWTKNKFPENF